MPNEAMNTEQAARYLGCHVNTIAEYVKSGKIKGAYRIGREWRFPLSSLDEYRRQNSAEASRAVES